MENINITKKYTQIGKGLLVVAVLFMVSPALTFAEVITDPTIEAGFVTDPVIEVGFVTDPVIEVGFITDPIIEVGGTVNSGYTSNGGTSYSNGNYTVPSSVSVSSGSFFGGGYGATSAGYSRASVTTPSSGGFSGGNAGVTSSNFNLASTQGINSGSFSGGNGFIPSNNFQVAQTYFPNNQVLALNDTPNLSSVYLSDVPYTGAGDTARVILFTLSLILWSAILTYAVLKRKDGNQEIFAMATNESNRQNGSFKMPSQMISDKQALEDIENLARENKILLSTSASTKLLKLERLNQINPKDLISKISKEDWICVGEGDIEKYL